MFKYISTKLKDVLYLYPERTFKTIKTIRDNGTFGLFIYNPKIKDYIEVPNIDLLNCDEAFITRTLQICNNIQVSSSSSSISSTSSSRSTSSSSQGEFVERYLYGWGSNDYNQITKSLLATISDNHLGKLVNGVPRSPNLRISKIASGDHFNVAVVENKTPITGGGDSYTQTVYAWGDNRYGQVDRNSDPTIDGTSVTLAGGFNTGYERIVNTITKTERLPSPLIACGKNHTVVLYSVESNETYIRLLGNNNYSQLGSSGTNQFPFEFSSNTDNMLLTCGNYFTYIVDFGGNFGQGQIYFNGDTRYKQNEIPSNITQNIQNINQLSAGGYHTAALLLDGTVVCWGKNTNGQCLGTDENGNAKISTTFGARTTVNGIALTNIVKIVAGENHTCALNSFGVVICWGDNNRGQCTVPTTLFDAVDVYAKGDTTVAIKRDGSIVMWGDVSKDKNNIPSYAKFTQGSVFSIGKEHCILLANKTTQEIPETTAPLTHFNQYVTDYFNNNIVRVYVTFTNGDNDGLSIGTDVDGEILPYSRSEAGKLFYYNNYIGGDNPNDTFYMTPNIVEETSYNVTHKGGVLSPYVKIKNEMLTDVIQLTSGDGFIVALKADGNVVAWGKNNLGECDVPSSANTVKKIYSWKTGSFALKQNGSIVSWGNTQNFPYSSFLTMTDVENYSFGKEHILILKKNGTIETITKGNDTYSLKLPPKKGKFTSIVSGYDHICALLDDGTVTCWGNNSYDQCDVPSGLNNVIQITCGLYLSAALKSDGTVVAWGIAAASQYGEQNTNIIKISAGPDYILALKNDHTVTMWPNVGSLNSRNLALNNIPANIRTGQTRTSQNPDVVDISAGHNVACAVLADTGMICWGKTFSTNDDEGVLCGRGGKSDPDYPWTLGDKVKTKVVKLNPSKTYNKYPYLPVDGAFKVVCEMSDLGGNAETSLNRPTGTTTNPIKEYQQTTNYAGTVALAHSRIFSFGKLSLSFTDPWDGTIINTWEKLQEDPRYATPKNISTSGINKDIVDVCFVNKRLWLVGKDYKVGAISLHEYDAPSCSTCDLYEPDFYLNGDRTNPNNRYDIFLTNIKVEQISAGRHHLIVVEKDTKNIYFFCHWNLINSFKDSLKNIPAILKETPTQLNNIVKIQALYNNNIALSSNNKLYVWGEDTYFLHYFPEHFYVRDFGMTPNRILYLDFNNNVRTWGGVGGFVPPVWIKQDLGRIFPQDTEEYLADDTGNLTYGKGSFRKYISTDIYQRSLIPQMPAYEKLCRSRGTKYEMRDDGAITAAYSYPVNSVGGPTIIVVGGSPCTPDSPECVCCRKEPRIGSSDIITEAESIRSDINPNTSRQKLNSWYSSRNNPSQSSEYIPFLLQRNTVYCVAGKIQKINDIKKPNIFSQSYIDKYVYHSGEENFAENDKTSNPSLRTDLTYTTVQPTSFGDGGAAKLPLTAVAINSKDANVSKTQLLATPTDGYSVSSSKTSITDYHDYNANKHPFRRKFSFDDDYKSPILPGNDPNWASDLWNTANIFHKKYYNYFNFGTVDYDQFYTQTIKYDVGWDDGTALFLGLGNPRNMNGTGLGKVPFNNDLGLIGRNYADEIAKCGTALWAVGYNNFGESYGINPNGEPRPILYKAYKEAETTLHPLTQYIVGPGGRNSCCLPQLKDSLLDPLYTSAQNTTRVNYFYCVREISCGLRYSCIVDEFGRVKCWGRNDTNQCNVPTIIASNDFKRAIDVKCGPFHACAMLKDGTVVCWGNNKIDQLDVPSDLTGVVAIECGAFHTCALKSDGTVRCWGNNREGQSDVPSSLKNVKQIACGHNHSIALRSDGKVVAWGSNEYGQCLGTDSDKNIIKKTTANLGSAIKGNGSEVSNIIKIFGSIDKTWLLRETGTNAAELLAFGLDASGTYLQDTLGSRILNGPSWNHKEVDKIPTNIGKMYNDTPSMFIKMPGCVATTRADYQYCQLKTTLPDGTWINVVTSTSDIYGGNTAVLDGFLKVNDEIEVGDLIVKGKVKSQYGIGFYTKNAAIVPAFPGTPDPTKMWQCSSGEYNYPITTPVTGDVGICMLNSATITNIQKVGGIIQIKLDRKLHIPKEIFDTYSPNDVVITFNNKQTNKAIYLEVDMARQAGRTIDAGLGNPYVIQGIPLLKYTSSDPQPRFIHVTKSGIVTWFTDDPNPV